MNVLFVLVVALNIVGIGNGFLGKSKIEKFLVRVPSIAGRRDLDEFKSMVKEQMIMALIQLVILGGAILVLIYGLVTDKLTVFEITVIVLLNVYIIIFSIKSKKTEEKAKTMPVTDELLHQEHQSVCEIWVKKPFPNW